MKTIHRVKMKNSRVFYWTLEYFHCNSVYWDTSFYYFDNQHCQQFVILENVVFLVTQSESE